MGKVQTGIASAKRNANNPTWWSYILLNILRNLQSAMMAEIFDMMECMAQGY